MQYFCCIAAKMTCTAAVDLYNFCHAALQHEKAMGLVKAQIAIFL